MGLGVGVGRRHRKGFMGACRLKQRHTECRRIVSKSVKTWNSLGQEAPFH